MSSVIAVVPEADLAVGVFTNAWFDEPAWASLAFVNAIALSVLDKEYGYDDVDWSSEMLRVVKDAERARPVAEPPRGVTRRRRHAQGSAGR